MLGKIGFILLMIGCAGIESENMLIPAIMSIVGITFIAITALKEKSFTPSRPK